MVCLYQWPFCLKTFLCLFQNKFSASLFHVFNCLFLLGCVCVNHPVVSESLQPHGLQPTRLLCPWDFPGKNTGVGCHCLLQCMKVKSESEVAQSCPALSDPMGCSLPGSSVHGIFQVRVLESHYCYTKQRK